MDIRFESQMLPIISKHYQKFASGLAEISEFGSGYGIADFVYYSFDKDVLQYRQTQNMEPIDSFDLIKILTFLNTYQGDKVSLTVLRQVSPNIHKDEEILSFLIEKSFLIANEVKNEFSLGEPYKIGLQDVVAVEAKLSNWSRGLYQAYRYKQFANKSYLALYSKYIHRALANKELFERCNVGLIEVGEDELITHVEPNRQIVQQNLYSAVAFERLLRFNKS